MNVLLNRGIVQRLVRQKEVNDERFVEPGHLSTWCRPQHISLPTWCRPHC